MKIHKHAAIAISSAIFAALANALMAGLTKVEVAKDISTALILSCRSLYSTLFLFALLFFSPPRFTISEKVKTNRFGLHIARGVTGFAGVFLYFYVLRTLSLTDATLLYFTIPLFMPFVGRIWKKKPFPRLGWIGLIMGFIGVICVIKPGHSLFKAASLLGLLSGVIITVGQFAAHLLTTTESNHKINFYYFLINVVIALPLSDVGGSKSWGEIQPSDYLFFLGIAVFGLCYLFFLNHALKHGPPTLVSSFLYTVVIFSMILDWWFWNIIAHWLTWLGALLIIVGVLLRFYFLDKDLKSSSSPQA